MRPAVAVSALVAASCLAACSSGSVPVPSATGRVHSAPAAASNAPAAVVTGVPSSKGPLPASMTPSAVVSDATTCARAAATHLTLSSSVAQLFDVGVNLNAPAEGSAAVREGAGAVFLVGRSQAGLAAAPAVARLQSVARAAGAVAPQVSADEEGGVVQSIDGPGIPSWPSALSQSAWTLGDLETRAATWAGSLHQLGLTLDLAPVADVVAAQDEADNPAIGALQRNYGTTPRDVSDRVDVVVSALQSAGVAATVKHFPGLGRTTTNTDRASYTSDPVATDEDVNLQPFASAIRAGVRAVMISSAYYPLMDATVPAAFSQRIITGVLRDRLHFTGLVVSDDLANARAVAAVPVGARAVEFVKAGGDMVLIVNPADFPAMQTAVLQAARTSPVFLARVQDAVVHVLVSKVEVGLLPCS